jgi:hypothetical protein
MTTSRRPLLAVAGFGAELIVAAGPVTNAHV